MRRAPSEMCLSDREWVFAKMVKDIYKQCLTRCKFLKAFPGKCQIGELVEDAEQDSLF